MINQSFEDLMRYPWVINQPVKDAESQIKTAIWKRYDKEWHLQVKYIGERKDIGVYSYYLVRYLMYPRHLGCGGEDETLFKFINDMVDESHQSASL